MAVQAICQPLPQHLLDEALQDMTALAKAVIEEQWLIGVKLSFRDRLELMQQKQRSAQQTQYAAVSLSARNHSLWYTRRMRVVSQTAAADGPQVLLFRGLCSLTSALQRQKHTADGPFSPLYVHQQHMYDDVWSHMSAMAVILHARRCHKQAPANNSAAGLMERCRHHSDELQNIAQRIRECMVTHLVGRNSAQPPRGQPASSDANRPWLVWWWKNSTSRTQSYSELYLPFQQSYTNDDKGFMQQFQTFIAEHNKGDAAFNNTMHHARHWKKAAKLVAWSFMRLAIQSADEGVALHQAGLHTNPNVSLSKGLQHAMRYVAGLKHYAQGITEGHSPPLDYGRRSDGGGYHNPKLDSQRQQCLRTPRVGQLLGCVVVFAVPESKLDEPYVVDVCRKAEDGLLWPDDRARHEEEVCFFGFVERDYQIMRHELCILDWDDKTLDALSSGSLAAERERQYAAYGVTRDNVRGNMTEAVMALRSSIEECVASTAHGWSSAELTVREQLATLALSALRHILLQRYTLTADSRGFEDEVVVQGTRR